MTHRRAEALGQLVDALGLESAAAASRGGYLGARQQLIERLDALMDLIHPSGWVKLSRITPMVITCRACHRLSDAVWDEGFGYGPGECPFCGSEDTVARVVPWDSSGIV